MKSKWNRVIPRRKDHPKYRNITNIKILMAIGNLFEQTRPLFFAGAEEKGGCHSEPSCKTKGEAI
jgi:hypothetical protein